MVGDLIFGLVLVSFLLGRLQAPHELGYERLGNGRPVFGKLPEIAKSAGTYFGVRTQLNLVTGVGFGLLWILGVDYAFLWGAMAFLLSYIPYIGRVGGHDSPVCWHGRNSDLVWQLGVAISSLVINLAIENFIEPRLTGQSFNLSPVMVLLAFSSLVGCWAPPARCCRCRLW